MFYFFTVVKGPLHLLVNQSYLRTDGFLEPQKMAHLLPANFPFDSVIKQYSVNERHWN